MVIRLFPLRTGVFAALASLLLCAPESAQAQRRCRVAEVTIAPPDAQFAVDGSYQFLATAYDAAGNPCDNTTFVWTSSNRLVVTVDPTGEAHGVNPGTATITARTGVGTLARSSTAAVTIVAAGLGGATAPTIPGFISRPGRPQGPGYAAIERQPDGTGPAENLVVDQSALVLVRGESQYLDFRPIGRDGSVASPVPILFSVDSGGTNIVQVDSLGLVSSRGEAGRALVRLTVPNQMRIQPKLVRVEVRNDTIRFNRTEFSLEPGATETLTVWVPQQSRSLDPSGLFTFRSTDSTRARVNLAQPIVQAVTAGTVQITGQGGGLIPDITATVHIHPRIVSLRLDPADTLRILAINDTTRIRASALGVDGTPIADAPLTWSAPDSVIASFDRTSGVVRGRRAGLAVVTVFAPIGRNETTQKTVRVRVVPGGLEAARSRFGLNVGQREAIEVQLLDEQRRPVRSALPYLTWTSSADTVARVDGNQIVAARPGRARLTGQTRWDSTVTLDVLVGGEMVAVHQFDGRLDLAMYWGGGANWKPLTADSLIEESPAWSPDLTRLAYAAGPVPPRNAIQRSALYVMNVDGTEALRVTDDSTRARVPSWVRGGAPRIVFEWNRTGVPQVWLCELPAGGGPCTTRQITTTAMANQEPAVSPSGDRIVYVSARQASPGRTTNNIYRAMLDGTLESAVYLAPQNERVMQPTFAPDGRALYFIRTERGRPATQRVYRLPLSGVPTDTAVALTPPTLVVRSFSFNADGSALMLNVLEPAPNNRTVSRLQLFTLATGLLSVPPTPPGDELAAPALRPAGVSANR